MNRRKTSAVVLKPLDRGRRLPEVFFILRRGLGRWGANEQGNIAIAFALSAPLMLGGAAFSVETSFGYFKNLEVQAAADSAAFAGALERQAGADSSETMEAARRAAVANGWSAGAGAIEVNTPPASGAYINENAVEVVLRQSLPRFFTAALTSAPLVAGARAVAVVEQASNACVLALSKTKSRAVNVQGSASLTLDGCEVAANSIASDAIRIGGSSSLTADCATTVGGVTNGGGLSLSKCATPITQASPIKDPFAGLSFPQASGANHKLVEVNGVPTVVSPGRYNQGMSFKGEAQLLPGAYYVTGGSFELNANANISGSGVTIFLAEGVEVKMNGNATVDLTAPTSGAYAGMLFFGDPDASDGLHKFNGTAGSQLTGNLYFPTQAVEYAGNFSGTNGCVHIVADTVEWTGSTTVSVDCTAQSMANIRRYVVKMVE